jgi:hypothetical protein
MIWVIGQVKILADFCCLMNRRMDKSPDVSSPKPEMQQTA